MRSWIAILLLVPALADAQSAPGDPAARAVPSLPPIGLPLAPIGLPLPPIGLPLTPGGTPTQSPNPGAERRNSTAARPGASGHRRDGRVGPGIIVVAPPYYWAGAPPGLAASPVPAAPAAVASLEATPSAKGTVWLEVEPRGVGEVFVDDYLVGTASELRGSLTVDAGPHRLEIRASSYEPIHVDVKVEPGGAVTLRRTLQLAGAPPAATARETPHDTPARAIPRKPFYFIPGCYLGDVPPTEARLPAGCSAAKTVVVPPQ